MEKDMGKHQMQWTKTHAPCTPLIVPGFVYKEGGGVFWTRPTHPTLDPPTQLLTHPDPPPSYNSVGSIFCEPN